MKNILSQALAERLSRHAQRAGLSVEQYVSNLIAVEEVNHLDPYDFLAIWLRHSEDAVNVHHVDGHYLHLSSAHASMLGYDVDELKSKSRAELGNKMAVVTYRFSQAPIWQRQQAEFQERGIDIWRSGSLPDYTTNNPLIAERYARVVLAFLADWAQAHPTRLERVYLVELGAGSGQLAFNFLKAFVPMVRSYPLELPELTYVITDFTQEIVAFSASHSRFASYQQRYMVDFAVWDAESSETLRLLTSGEVIQPQSLVTPLLLIANYFFATIRQDMFYFSAGSMFDVYIPDVVAETIVSDDGSQFGELYDPAYRQRTTAPYQDDVLNAICTDYQQALSAAHVLLPYIGIACLKRLRALSQQGFFMLSTDIGYVTERQLNGLKMPPLFHKKSAFYLTANYHAILSYFQRQGGQALVTSHRHPNLTTVGLLALSEPEAYGRQTQSVFLDAIEAYGPDDIYELAHLLEARYDFMTLGQAKMTLRLNRYDPRVFARLTKRLCQLLADASEQETEETLAMLPQIENMYYPLGQNEHLSFFIGQVLYAAKHYQEAKARYVEAAEAGMVSDVLFFNLALTHTELREWRAAKANLSRVFDLNPNHRGAHELRKYLSSFTLFG